MTRRIVPIVEGHSEARSIPVFLRRILHDAGVFDIEVDRAIREHRSRLVKQDVLVNRVRMAELRPDCVAVVIAFDVDDDAACVLGPTLREFISAVGIWTPCSIVLAVREVEAWLLAGIESLRGQRGIPRDLASPSDPESIRGAKEWLDRSMENGYKPTIDQLPLLSRLDYQSARHRARSLDRLLREVGRIARLSQGSAGMDTLIQNE